MGKILQVDLLHSKIGHIPTKPYAEKYLGGRGIASRLYWETVSPETKAFDPENRLIFMTGPMVAKGAQGANRMSVVGKSPMTCPEGYCYGNMGGFFGAELCDASHMWGQGAYATGEMPQETHGMKVRFLTNGLAGENLVRSAVMFGSHQSTTTGGFGAVMGSKNFKAIAVKGTKRPSVADSARLKELNRYTLQICKRLRLAIPPLVLATEHGDLLEVFGKGGCHQCGLECIRNVYRYDKKLEGDRRCQAMEYYLPWRYDQDDEPVKRKKKPCGCRIERKYSIYVKKPECPLLCTGMNGQ
jgi:aldehyde:ferredoxin oxidoreductase